MSEILEQAGVSGEIDLVKCDIEGAEAEVLARCADWITRVRALVIELHAPYTEELLRRDLAANGFTGKFTTLKRGETVHTLMVERNGVGKGEKTAGADERTSVSILIPTHNRGKVLNQTLQSLAEMEYPPNVDVELVVVANACTDDTEDRVRSFAGKIPNIRCVSEPMTGLGHARNRCVWSSRLEICALLDDDVWVDRGWLASLVETYRTTAADMVAGRIELWWESVARPDWLTRGMEGTLSCIDLGPEIVRMDGPHAIGANFSFRRKVFDAVGPFRPDLDRIGNQLLGGGETFFARQAMTAGFSLYYSPGASLKHWVSPHRVEAPYLTGVARGTAFSIVRLKERFGPFEATKNLVLGGARMVGYSLLSPIAARAGSKGSYMQAIVRRAIGQGQFFGSINRIRSGPLSAKPERLPTA